MTPLKPYLIRSLHEWILDNGLTPYLLVNVHYEGVSVPKAYISEGRIILNTHPSAVTNWALDNEVVSFSARFSGKSEHIYIPVAAVLATYAKENGKGMMFDEQFGDDVPPDPETPSEKKATKKPALKLVK
jgi:stringent starvation protein B